MKLTQIVNNTRRDPRIKELFITEKQVKTIVRVFLEKCLDAIKQDGEAKLFNFMTLSLRKSKGRRIRNPQTKEYMTIPDFYRINIRPSKELKRIMKNY